MFVTQRVIFNLHKTGAIFTSQGKQPNFNSTYIIKLNFQGHIYLNTDLSLY